MNSYDLFNYNNKIKSTSLNQLQRYKTVAMGNKSLKVFSTLFLLLYTYYHDHFLIIFTITKQSFQRSFFKTGKDSIHPAGK